MATAARRLPTTWSRFVPLVALSVALLMGVVALHWLEVDWQALASLGYGGVFLTCLASSATVAVPVPGIAAVFLAGKFFDPVLVGLAAGLGSALGELSGYFLGYSGRAALGESTGGKRFTARLEGWVNRFGFPAILVLAFIPNPVFDMAGVAAGAARMPPATFFVALVLGKTSRMILVALAGQYALDWLIA